jgi:hypothetical protein
MRKIRAQQENAVRKEEEEEEEERALMMPILIDLTIITLISTSGYIHI